MTYTTDTMNETTTETVAAFRRTQVVFPEWMQQAVAGLADTDLVTVTRKNAGFLGSWVLAVAPA